MTPHFVIASPLGRGNPYPNFIDCFTSVRNDSSPRHYKPFSPSLRGASATKQSRKNYTTLPLKGGKLLQNTKKGYHTLAHSKQNILSMKPIKNPSYNIRFFVIYFFLFFVHKLPINYRLSIHYRFPINNFN